jgi:hypothetical protein
MRRGLGGITFISADSWIGDLQTFWSRGPLDAGTKKGGKMKQTLEALLSSRILRFCNDIEGICKSREGEEYKHEPTIFHLTFDSEDQYGLTIGLIVSADPRVFEISGGSYGREAVTFNIYSHMSPAGFAKLLSELNTFATLIGTDDFDHDVSIRIDAEMWD